MQDPRYEDPGDIEPGPHTAVSNRSTETAPIVPEGRPASHGSLENIAEARDGVEALARDPSQGSQGSLLSPPEAELPDIATASYGAPADISQVVRGPDNRAAIEDTTAYPWRGVASLVITARDNSVWSGTGWFSGPQTLVTAGHALYIKGSSVPERDGWVKSVDVLPARNGKELPYGAVRSVSLRTTLGWTRDRSEFYDYGAINIPVPLGKTVGWFGYSCASNDELSKAMVNIAVYPDDKGGTQWYDNHRLAGMDTRKFYYDLPTLGGQSGSPVYKVVDGQRVVVGIHSYGGTTTDSATRISMSIFRNIQSWTG